MRTRVIYIAYDDKEFESKEECEKYEEKVKTILKELITNYNYLDKDKTIINFDESDDIEIELDSYNYIWQNMEYIVVHAPLSKETLDWLNYEFGFELPPNDPGTYKYNWDRMRWDKVG